MSLRNQIWAMVALGALVTLGALLLAASNGAASAVPPVEKPYTRNVAIVLYEGVEALDFAGPLEVFAAAGRFGTAGGQRAFNVYTVSKTKRPLTSQGVLTVTPQYSIDDAPKPDLIVIPGGSSSSVTDDDAFMKWVTENARASELTMTVCTGAFTLGKAGLLDGLDVTTFFDAIDGLQVAAPKARVQRGRRFIDNGHYVTTAGVSAGMDGALHVVARLLGRRVADKTAQYMEYRWTPESYLVGGYSLLNPSLDTEGRALEQAQVLAESKAWDAAAVAYRHVLDGDPNNHEAWYELGMVLHSSQQYAAGVEASLRATEAKNFTASGYYNAACGSSRGGDPAHAIEYLGKALDAGLPGGPALADPDLENARKDPRWATLAKRLK